MTYGVARAATAPELALYRTPGKKGKIRAAIYQPHTIYTARVNQTFSTTDSILSVVFDTGSGTLANVKADMTLLVGSSAGAHDKGICRIRSTDATHFYIGETSDIDWADNLYLTVIDAFEPWAKHVLISSGVTYMDGSVAYTNQHSAPDPVVIMGSNRVLELTGASVSSSWMAALSYLIDGSSTSSYAWTCATASSSSGTTTATPTFAFNTFGWHLVYCTVTAANGKTFFGVRYVYVYDQAHLPPSASFLSDPRQDAESGGWEFELVLFDNAGLDTVRERALVIVFSEDHFGDTQQSIGPVDGAENILVEGWIARESIRWHPAQGQVSFTAYTAQYWLSQIPAFPDGVEFISGTPAAWTEFQNLTVDKGLWHFLHWRTTITRIMDVFLTGDTKYTKEVSSLASNLWEQIREMAWSQIYARAGCNAWNQLFIQVHPQLMPLASRTWATVLTITKADWQDEIDFERITQPEVAVVSLSGVAVNASGVGTSYFALSPGHAYPHYGTIEIQDRLLVESQAQTNALAGLYRGWHNNPYPEMRISFAADIRLISCFPRSKCALTISAGDTPRGISYSGNLIPTAVTIVTDPKTGSLHREVSFEAETFQDLAVNGDIPGSRADISIPPPPPLPHLPATLPVILPGTVEPTTGGPRTVVIHDATNGLLYTTDFNLGAGAHWIFFNAGLTVNQRQRVNLFFTTPSGVCYCGYISLVDNGPFFARAPYAGGTWTILYDQSNLQDIPGAWFGVRGAGCNPFLPDRVGLALYKSSDGGPYFYLGDNGVFTKKVAISSAATPWEFRLSFGLNKWLASSDGAQPTGRCRIISADGVTVESVINLTGTGTNGVHHVRASTSGRTFHERSSAGLFIGENNLATWTELTTTGMFVGDMFAADPTGQYCMTYGTTARARSSDGGFTWGLMGNLPYQGNYRWAYAGGIGIASRWLAAGGVEIYYSENFGDSWVHRVGNLYGLIPVPNLNMVRVLEY